MSIRELLEANIETIEARYLAGESTKEIAKDYGCSCTYVWQMLKNRGVQIRFSHFPKSQISKAIGLYNEGHCSTWIGEHLGIPVKTVYHWLGKSGIDLTERRLAPRSKMLPHFEDIKGRYEAGEGYDIIAKSYGVYGAAVRSLLKKGGVKTRGLRDYSHPVNQNFFDEIDTEEKAYVLGFFMADASNDADRGVVRISITDQDILELMASAMGYEGPIKPWQPRNPRHKVQYRIDIGSRHMSDALVRVGCVIRKTYCATFPSEDIVPRHLQKFCLLGWHDGDGTLTSNKKRGTWHARTVGTEAVCRGIATCLHDHLDIRAGVCPVHTSPTGYSTWAVTVGARMDLKRYLDWMYKDSTIHLPRKFAKYQEFLASLPRGYLAS